MAKRNSTQAAGSPAATEKKVDDVTMTNEKAGEAKGEVAPSAKTSQDENEIAAPIDGEQATGSNKRKRDFKAEREAKRQRKEERNAPKKAAAVVREAEEAIAREKKFAEKAEAKRIREEEVARLREQKKEEKAKKHEENLRQQDEDKQRRVEEKKKEAEAKKRDAEEKRKDRERIQALEKQVRDLKRGHGNGKGKGAKRSWDKKAKGPKTSEFFGEGLKAQVIGDGDDEEVEEEANGEVAEEAKEEIKKIKSKRSWKDLKKGNVAPTGLEAKIAAARASVAQAEDTLDGNVTMEDAPEVNGEQDNEAEEGTAEPAVGNSDVVAYPSLEHLIEDNAEDIPESAAESDAPAQTEVDAEIPEETSDDKADEEQADSEIPEEDSKETSPAVKEEDKAEDDSSKENAAPAADSDMEVDEPKEEAEASASAKKRSRKRGRNNNRLDAEDTPTKPVTPASSKNQKVKTPTATPLSSKNQNVKTPTKSPAQTKATVAKKGRPPVKAANKAQTAPKSSNVSRDSKSPKAKRGRVPKARAAVLASAPGLDSPARNTRRSAKANHSCEIDEGTVDELGGTDITTGTNNDNDDDDDVYESITCESPEHFNHESQTPSKTLQSFNDMELPILRKTESLDLNADESDSSELSDLSITDHPFLASDSSGFDTIEVDVPSLLRSGKKQRPPMHSPYFALPLSSTPSKSRKSIVLKGESTNKNPSPKKESPKKRPPGIISCIPFPPLSAPHFGLIQEKLAHDPFRLLIAVTFLNRTHGKQAIPVFYTLMDQYPTPQSIVDAPKEDIVSVIRHLGLQNQRAATYQAYAKTFCENPPVKNKRYAVHDYPTKGLGRDVKKSEVLPEESVDPRIGWEMGNMTQGPYAIDSWRIFCRDMLLEKAKGWNGEGSEEEGFQPEWMWVLPEDKELRAFLRWMWLKEGFEWDPLTGEKEVAGREVMRAALEGRIAWDEGGGMRILDRVGEVEGVDVDNIGKTDG
ncbi:hypothetical protein BCON_0136g00300 [Botryotinia convoluta]|uniref:HhH-GPD domain-containing protein n=1 Tax=Botryotinia convoluta TaxID=54673 RepID=A0A4Z1I722_9HELO|nr:hypothetical protein BCON_0136g00300 [Botryotinia convoluta]